MYVQIALDVPLDTPFDYLAGDATEADLGRLAVVPFGRGRRVGVIVGVSDRAGIDPARVRRVHRIARHLPAVPAEIRDLAAFASRYYHHPLGEILTATLPTALRRPEMPALTPGRAWQLTADGRSMDLQAIPPRAKVQRSLMQALAEGSLRHAQLLALAPSAAQVLRVLAHAGWVEEIEADAPGDRLAVPPDAVPSPVTLMPEQQAAVTEIEAALGGYRPFLLQGVTGSGKTEVYLRSIAATLARGGQALLLVPEISLTPQLLARVAARFGSGQVVALHSGLAEGERLERWLRAVRGEVAIVVGTRLAVFTPLPRLGLILVDEEHDGSYKQQEGHRYHARDLAVARASALGIPVVLGSATPSLESVRQADAGRYRRLALTTRASGAAPEVRLLDMRALPPGEWLAPAAAEALAGAIERGEQSLVFLNRRGYSPTLLCHACGWVAPCHRCSARLTWHQGAGRLRCHHCGHEARSPVACPSCGNQDLRPLGQGTERLEEQLARRFPTARIDRVDRDTTRRRDAFDTLRHRVASHEVDVLVGTQMLAKGHDFPNLTQVIVVGADQALFSADYRAEERLFALLLQVAGRAGRGERSGRVLVQTHLPDHPLFHALRRQDFEGFAEEQLRLRQGAGFPPFVHQALLRAEAVEEAPVFEFLDAAAAAARTHADGVEVFDPVPATVARVAGRWRGQLLVQGERRPALHRFLDAWLPGLASSRVRWSIDVDPVDF